MTKTVLIIASLALIGCLKPQCKCGGPHKWGKWSEPTRRGENGINTAFVLQERTCSECGLVDVEWH